MPNGKYSGGKKTMKGNILRKQKYCKGKTQRSMECILKHIYCWE